MRERDTTVDLAKVTQLLDTGWNVTLYKNGLGNYTAIAIRKKESGREEVIIDDSMPGQALTRLAYKVLGDIV